MNHIRRVALGAALLLVLVGCSGSPVDDIKSAAGNAKSAAAEAADDVKDKASAAASAVAEAADSAAATADDVRADLDTAKESLQSVTSGSTDELSSSLGEVSTAVDEASSALADAKNNPGPGTAGRLGQASDRLQTARARVAEASIGLTGPAAESVKVLLNTVDALAADLDRAGQQ